MSRLSFTVPTSPALQGESDVWRFGRVRSCVRPVDAACRAAGPDAIRGSAPNQFCALKGAHEILRVGPIPGSTGFAISAILHPRNPGVSCVVCCVCAMCGSGGLGRL